MATNNTRLDLLLKEIDDKYVQENFYRLKLYLDRLLDDGLLGVSGSINNTTVINNNSVWEEESASVTSSGTLTIDTVPLISFSRIKYYINFKGATTSSTKGIDLTVQNNNGVLTESVSSVLGEGFSIITNITDDGVDMSLEVTNNEAETLNVTFLKAII